MTPEEFVQLEKQVKASRYRQQDTYEIRGVCYSLEYHPETRVEYLHWQLWCYPTVNWGYNIVGQTLEETFAKAKRAGVPTELLSLYQWHD